MTDFRDGHGNNKPWGILPGHANGWLCFALSLIGQNQSHHIDNMIPTSWLGWWVGCWPWCGEYLFSGPVSKCRERRHSRGRQLENSHRAQRSRWQRWSYNWHPLHGRVGRQGEGSWKEKVRRASYSLAKLDTSVRLFMSQRSTFVGLISFLERI